ncbi:SDR family NAD(P)-dependent oxidoreductase [Chloroflexota bacterium]
MKKSMNLNGRIAIVTGGSRGIGRGIALALAKAGADIAFCYSKDEEGAKTTTMQLEATGRRCLSFCADVTNYCKVKEMVAATINTFGGVDLLVNNAGIIDSGSYLADEPIEDMCKVINTHVLGSFYFVKEVLPHMRKHIRGDVYFISSAAALTFRAGRGALTIAKAGIEAMARCLAKEELSNNIRVNVIGGGIILDPQMMDTEPTLERWRKWHELRTIEDMYQIMPFGRTGTAEDIGKLIAFLASEEGGWISGQVIYVDGGAQGFSVPRLLSQG